MKWILALLFIQLARVTAPFMDTRWHARVNKSKKTALHKKQIILFGFVYFEHTPPSLSLHEISANCCPHQKSAQKY